MRRIFLFAFLALVAGVMAMPAVQADNGFDPWGYNYTAKCFNGYYGNYSRPPTPVSAGDWLQMKWNSAWMSKDKVRHDGYTSYLDSGAWLTNHIRWMDDDGKEQEYFVKIVAAQTTWTLVGSGDGGEWFDADGDLVGTSIWGEFYIALEVESGSGLLTKAPVGPGLGNK